MVRAIPVVSGKIFFVFFSVISLSVAFMARPLSSFVQAGTHYTYAASKHKEQRKSARGSFSKRFFKIMETSS
jgi:hypothetical protein